MRAPVGLDLEALDLGDRRFVDARERDAALVGRPPVAGVAIHLFLRDELGHAEAHEAAAVARDRALGAVGEIDDEEVLVAHEAHEVRARREARVGFVGRRCCVSRRTASAGLRAKVVHVQIAVERDQQVTAVGREAVFDDAGVAPRCAGVRGALPLRPTGRGPRRRACASPPAGDAARCRTSKAQRSKRSLSSSRARR